MVGNVERVTFFNEESGYAILKVAVAGKREPVTVVGKVVAVEAGEQIEADGRWSADSHWGNQFRAESIRTRVQASTAGMVKYLGSGLVDGIGPVNAERIVARFGAETFDIIERASKRLEEVEGIGPKRRKEIKASWEKQKAVRQIMVFLHGHGISGARAARIYREYGDGAVASITENPFRLAEDIWGIGFKSADKVARSMGIASDSPLRVAAGALHVLEHAAAVDGHCALRSDQLTDLATEMLSVEPALVASAVETLLGDARLRSERLEDCRFLYLPRLLAAERGVARELLQRIAKPSSHPEIDATKAIPWVEEKTGRTLAAEQRQAVRTALTSRVLVVTGGPGVGKTTIVQSILAILAAKKVRAVLAAPTGRAAKRLSESTGQEAKTLHRLLEYQPGTGFARNSERRLVDGDLFVLDEASMVDVALMHAFLQALPESAHLLIVGDVDQLPSVGPGAVLGDTIASGAIPIIRLTEIFRQAAQSHIITAAHAINAGSLPDTAAPPAGSKSDFYFIARDSPEDTAGTIVELVRDRIPRAFGFDPVKEVQVLTPMKRGPLGTAALNKHLQDGLNPPHEFAAEVERFGTNFRVGDKVIQLRNNYDLDVYNGDIGTIIEIATDPVLVRVNFGGGRELATYQTTQLDELLHAYAVTIHKSQGSEFPCVVIPVHSTHYVMLQRNLIYTGVTRGKSLVILVGETRALQIAVRNADANRRITGLKERLNG